ncbi:zinc finger protein 831 isoform X2 [Choloepus didactylus]|uniref:zinc finger protein 831 isoform X2 n=1 Tax=Choloepus didactylus TaxID=27675 RepID=UPI00189CBDA8|nr:zinc finger protein 831 isoform X2 [Choloepus didactylus]
MEVPGLTCSAPPAGDQPTPQPGMPGAPGGQTSPRLALGPVLLPPEQGLAPTVFLKALPVPLYHTVPPGGLQPRAPLVAGGPDGGGLPFILSPLLQPDGLGPTQGGKPPAPTLTVNIVGALPVLSPGLGPPLGSPGKVRKAGKYLCPHCGRDCLKPSVLEKHIRSHTGERPFPCATCGIAFKTQSNLYKHRRTQTHLNNSRLSSEAEAGGGLPEEGDRATTAPRAEGLGQRVGDGPSGRPPSPGVRGAGLCPPSTTHLPLTARKPDVKLDAGPRPGSPLDRETPLDSSHTACPGLPPAGTQPRWKLPEQKSPPASRPCPLQRQQATSWEKPWDAKGSEGRLRKWESTDSGYLSRSDSVEQPPAPASPLHSLSEHSTEAEGTPGPGAVPGPRAAALALEKQQLEERIARLISHNQAVVDDPQLDTVRPRKTVLSQQGSLDLPTPYTYKDSFHFDLRAREPGRHRQAALCTARSACGPGDRARPLFFHSVPTQLSTTVECGPVTRSNSLPLVEGTRTWREQPGPREAWPRKQKPLSPRPGPARLGCSLGLSWAGGPSTHPRALVRQAAVEDLPCAPAGDTLAPAQALDGKGSAAREGAVGKGGGAGKKCGRRKPKMFSQEKWQVYGDETFKRIYQKMKTSYHGGRRGKEERVGEGPGLDPHPRGEATAQPGQLRIPVCRGAPFPPGAASDGAVPGLLGRQVPQDVSLATEPPEQREPEARPGGSGQPGLSRAVSSPLSGRDAPCVGSKSLFLLPAGGPEPGGQLARGGQPEAPRPGLPDPKEGGAHGEEGEKEAALCGQSTPRLPSRGSGAPQPVEDKLPSERKKLKVEGLSSLEKSEPLGAGGKTGETPDGPARPTSPQEPGGPPQSADGTECGKARLVDVPAEPLVLSPAGVPNRSSSQPRPPGFLAQADDAFPPKYLLRLPRRETHSPRPVARESMQEPLCKRAWPQELAPFAGPGKGDPLSPSPASGRTPDAADSVLVDPGCSRLWDGVKGKQSGQDSGTRTDTSTPAPGESPGVAAREMASSVATLTCDSVTARSSEGEACTIRHLCMSSPAARAVSSGGLSKPWAPRATEDPPQGPPLWLRAGCCPQAGSFPWAVTLPQGPPPAQAEPASSPHSGTPRSCGAEGPFPSLKAEPQLTWCCLSCSIPLPAEQEGASSVFSRLHPPAGSSLGLDPDPRPLSKAAPEGWISTSLGDRGLLQTWQLSCPRAPGMTSQFRMSEPERKAGLHSRRVRTSRGSGKQKKLRINPKRYRGSFLQRRVQLRASRLHKVALRKGCHPHRLERPDPSRTGPQVSSEVAGNTVLGGASFTVSHGVPHGYQTPPGAEDAG